MAITSPPIKRSDIPNLLEQGIRKVVADEFALRVRYYEIPYEIVPSVEHNEDEVIVGSVGQLIKKNEGAVFPKDTMQEAWKVTTTHDTWALEVSFTQEVIEDNLYAPAVHPTGVELARAAMYTRNVQAFDFFNDITKTIYTAGGTDFGLGSTAHSTIDGINWSNKFAAKVDLSIENLELALQNWFNQMVDQRSRKWDVTPRFLMVAPGDMMRAERLLASTQLPEGGDNDPNVVRRRNLQLIVNPHMTDDNRWFLIAAPGETGLRFYTRLNPTVERDKDVDTGNVLIQIRDRNSHAIVHPTGVYCSA